MIQFIVWTPEEEAILITGVANNVSFENISREINERFGKREKGFPAQRSIKAVERKYLRICNTLAQDPVALKNKTYEVIKETDLVTTKWKKIKEIQALYKSKSKFDSTGVTKNLPAKKILCLSDIHFPFSRWEFLQEAIDDHRDADILVLNGDILDGYIYSVFEKDSVVAAIDEYNTAFEFLDMCSKIFKEIYLTWGNHDARAERALKRVGMTSSAYGVFGTNLLARLANGEKLNHKGLVIEKKDWNNIFFPPSEPWWVQIGKTLFIHPHDKGGSKPGHTVNAWSNKFKTRLPAGSFDSIVCGHTHQTYKGIVGGLLLIEQGCLSDYMSYSWSPASNYSGNASSGYAVIYQDANGNTDFNLSNFYYLGQLFPTDKPVIGGTLNENEINLL